MDVNQHNLAMHVLEIDLHGLVEAHAIVDVVSIGSSVTSLIHSIASLRSSDHTHTRNEWLRTQKARQSIVCRLIRSERIERKYTRIITNDHPTNQSERRKFCIDFPLPTKENYTCDNIVSNNISRTEKHVRA